MNATISFGVLAQRTGCTVPTIRYYEEIGLLPPGPRTEAGRRFYREPEVERLMFVRRCRDFGFSIDQVREIVRLVDDPARPCVEVRDIALIHLVDVRKKLTELRALEFSLSAFVVSCGAACASGPSVDCNILEDLRRPVDASRPANNSCCGTSGGAISNAKNPNR